MKQTQSAGGVVVNKQGLVLIVSQHGWSWSLPKGHIEKDESPVEAAKREIYEETGVSGLEFIKDLGNYQRYNIGKDVRQEDKSELKTISMILFRTDQETLKPVDRHNPEARWIEKEGVAELLTHPKDKEFFLSIVDQI